MCRGVYNSSTDHSNNTYLVGNYVPDDISEAPPQMLYEKDTAYQETKVV